MNNTMKKMVVSLVMVLILTVGIAGSVSASTFSFLPYHKKNVSIRYDQLDYGKYGKHAYAYYDDCSLSTTQMYRYCYSHYKKYYANGRKTDHAAYIKEKRTGRSTGFVWARCSKTAYAKLYRNGLSSYSYVVKSPR